MRAKIPALLLLLLCSVEVMAQENRCSLKLSDLPVAPELVGFRMGMTVDEVKARVPQVVFGRVDEFAVSKTSINPDFDPRFDKTSFAGVRTVSLDFLDGRLTSLWLGYDDTFKWKTVEDFVAGISRSLQLPNTWTPWRSRGQQLRCVDFHMTISIVAEGPSFRIVDDNAEQTLTARRVAREELESGEQEEPANSAIVADRASKLYYSENCPPPREILASNRVIFVTREDAEKAGYKPAKECE
jgi:hypothetical protein